MESRLRQQTLAPHVAEDSERNMVQASNTQGIQSHSTLNGLPAELIIEIFRHVLADSTQDNPAALAQTSRKLRSHTLPGALSRLWAIKRLGQMEMPVWTNLTMSQRNVWIKTVMNELASHHATGPRYLHPNPLRNLIARPSPIDIEVTSADLPVVTSAVAKRISTTSVYGGNGPLLDQLIGVIESLQDGKDKGEACRALAIILGNYWDAPDQHDAHNAMFNRLIGIIRTLTDSISKAGAVDELTTSIGLHHGHPEILARKFNSVADIVLELPNSIVMRGALSSLIQAMASFPEGDSRIAAFQRVLVSVQGLEDPQLKRDAALDLVNTLRTLADSERSLAEFHAVANLIGSIENAQHRESCINRLAERRDILFSAPEHAAIANAAITQLQMI